MSGRLIDQRRLAGFTLIELLIVVIIIGILLAIGVPAYLTYQAKAKDTDAKAALMTAYKAAVADDSEVNNGKFPVASTVVQDIQADEPGLSVARASCATAAVATPKQVLVDPASTSTNVVMCVQSASAAIWKLSGPLTGTPTVADGSTVPLIFANHEITDAERAAGVSGDGLTNDSSTGVWDSSTNGYLYGGFENGASTGWTRYVGGGATSTVSATQTQAKFGTWSLLVADSGTAPNEGTSSLPAERPAAAPGDIWTVSEWVFAPAGAPLEIGVEWFDSTNTYITGTYQSFAATGSWQRLTVTGTAPANTAAVGPLGIRTTSTWTGSVYLDGIQLEKKPFATPYIDTEGATGFRAYPRIQAPASLITATQSWIAVRTRMGWSSGISGSPGKASTAYPRFFDWSQDTNNRFFAGYDATASQWLVQRITGGTGTNAYNTTTTFNRGDLVTCIFAWDPSGVKLSINGGAFSSGSGAAVPAITTPTFDIGQAGGSSYAWDGDILWLATGTGTLTNADAATINSWGSTDPKRASFPVAAQATMTWDGTSAAGSMK